MLGLGLRGFQVQLLGFRAFGFGAWGLRTRTPFGLKLSVSLNGIKQFSDVILASIGSVMCSICIYIYIYIYMQTTK